MITVFRVSCITNLCVSVQLCFHCASNTPFGLSQGMKHSTFHLEDMENKKTLKAKSKTEGQSL